MVNGLTILGIAFVLMVVWQGAIWLDDNERRNRRLDDRDETWQRMADVNHDTCWYVQDHVEY